MRARPPAAQKGRGGPQQQEGSGLPFGSLFPVITLGGLIGVSALFAAIPKPDFYQRNTGASNDPSGISVPEPLAAKKNALKYQKEQAFAPAGAKDMGHDSQLIDHCIC